MLAPDPRLTTIAGQSVTIMWRIRRTRADRRRSAARIHVAARVSRRRRPRPASGNAVRAGPRRVVRAADATEVSAASRSDAWGAAGGRRAESGEPSETVATETR